MSLFIIVATASTSDVHGGTDIQTSAQDAAEALRPIAGDFASWLFAARNYRHRLARGPGARRFRGLRARRAPRLDGRVSTSNRRDARLFYGLIIAGIAIRTVDELSASRSDQGAVLVGGNERGCRGSVDGDHYAHGDAQRRDGRLRAAAGAVGDGVAVHRDDGGCGRNRCLLATR